MNLFAFASLVASWATLFLGSFVYAKNSRSSINRQFLALTLGETYWATTEFGFQHAETFETAYFWYKLGIFWPFVLALLFHFALVFTGQEKQFKKPIGYFLIYFPAALLSLLDGITNKISGNPVECPWGWASALPEMTLLFYSTLIWAVGISLGTLSLLFLYYVKLTDYTRKYQTKYIVLGLVPSVLAGVITEGVFLSMRLLFPALTVPTFAFSCIIIGYTISKHQLSILTPTAVAENILTTMSDFLFLISPEGTIQHVNQVTLHVLGYDESELIGQPMTQLFADKGVTNWVFNRTGQEAPSRPPTIHDVETSLITKAGQKISISLSNSLIHDSEGLKGIVYLARDITEWKRAEAKLQKAYEELEVQVEERTAALQREVTERKRAEKEIHKLSQFLERIIDNANVWLNVLDEHANVVIWNKAAEEISGYSRDEVIGHGKIWEWLYPDETYCNEVLSKAIDIIEGKQVDTDAETTIRCKDGQTKIISWYSTDLVDEKNKPIGSIAIGRDITEWKRAEAALRESEARYRSLFENAPISLWEQDFSAVKQYLDQLRQNGVSNFQIYLEQHPEVVTRCIQKVKVVDVNETTLAMYDATSKDELFGDLSSQIFMPVSYEQYRDGLIALLEGNTVFETESIRKTLKGNTLHISPKWSLAPGYEDTWAKVFVSVVDITARKQAEAARQDLEKRKAEFIAMTSHELRTPLTAIRGYVEILEHRLNELDQVRREQCFEILNRNVHRLERLIAGVSTLGQIERGVFHLDQKKIDFCNLLREALQPYQTFLGQQLEVRDCSEDVSVLIDGDADRLLQVLDNLLENAVKHTPPDRRKILVALEIRSNEVCVQVTDNGAGIAPEDLTYIFEPFIAIPTQYSTGGTGIGLYVSRMIVEAHGGTLTAHSAGEGQGACFTIELPQTKMA